MAKITYGGKLGKYGELDDFYNPNKIKLDSATSKEVVYVDTQGGEKIEFDGDHLKVNNNGVLNGGTVEEIHFTLKFGAPLITVTNIDMSAQPIAATLAQHGVQGLLDLALSGNDTVIGSALSDYLIGGGGKDKISGGGGEDHIRGGIGNDRLSGDVASDTFIFKTGDGDDVITDFDAKGGNRAQDYIQSSDHTYTIIDSGADTIIDFGGGDTIKLLNVVHTDVGASDFI